MNLITPDWPAPSHIHALTTTRYGGYSNPPYDSLNLGDHVADQAQHVTHNRQRLIQQARLPEPPRWLSQTHGTTVLNSQDWSLNSEADAMISRQKNHVCTVLTADCLPILLTNTLGTEVAAIHAGWRGLVSGIIENTVKKMMNPAQNLLAWLGPAIGPQQFEVGMDVYNAFITADEQAKQCFRRVDAEHFLADIYMLARQRLTTMGVNSIYGAHWCTVSQTDQFFSYRRDGETGRMATMIWIANK